MRQQDYDYCRRWEVGNNLAQVECRVVVVVVAVDDDAEEEVPEVDHVAVVDVERHLNIVVEAEAGLVDVVVALAEDIAVDGTVVVVAVEVVEVLVVGSVGVVVVEVVEVLHCSLRLVEVVGKVRAVENARPSCLRIGWVVAVGVVVAPWNKHSVGSCQYLQCTMGVMVAFDDVVVAAVGVVAVLDDSWRLCQVSWNSRRKVVVGLHCHGEATVAVLDYVHTWAARRARML